ncbi:MAG TPA: helix-turn-helix domain-containing protein [Bacillota bacterium]|nr:helix-turn-helix domain-containing protein [Bacillota bacterium]
MEAAARLLLDRSLSVTEVCYQVGFQSLSHFQRLFRDFYGKSPSAYRKKH